MEIKKEEKILQKRKWIGTIKVRRRGGKGMKETEENGKERIKNAESLEAVHTHTHKCFKE